MERDVPDAVNVLDGVADLFPQLLLIELHLRENKNTHNMGKFIIFNNSFIKVRVRVPVSLV